MTVQAHKIEAALDCYARSAGVKPIQAYYIWGEFRVEHDGHVLYSDEAHDIAKPARTPCLPRPCRCCPKPNATTTASLRLTATARTPASTA